MADDLNTSQATREAPAQATDQGEFVRMWLEALSLSSEEEVKWREKAEDTIKIYRNQHRNIGNTNDINAGARRFNILHSNVETIIPAIYNSTPIPDVRRRFNDDDKAGKEVADLIERALSFSVDSYDFDDGMRHDIKDMELTGRGLSRIRYVPYLGKGDDDDAAGAGAAQSAGQGNGSPEPASGAMPSPMANGDEGVLESGKETGETLDYEEVLCEHVPWKHFRHGPARVWADVPWIAFELFLTREELVKLAPKTGGKVELDTTLAGADKDKRDGENIKEIFKRARVWEIWDKDTRKVIFIATSYKDAPLKVADDPLDLMQFFPVPKPLYAIETSDNLIPIVPYDIYRDQAEELERVSRRIMALVEAIKSRGIYDGSMKEIDQLAEADDNTLIAVENAVRYADGKGIESGIAWWPIEQAVKALAQLVEHRDRIKETIYEITGISDILRGQTEASETATAQQIKQQWGSLRIQNKQAAIQRYARDLFRLKAEIIANKFQWQTISLMTGLDYPTQEQKQQAQLAVQQMQQQAQQQPAPQGQPGQPPQAQPQQPQIPDQLKAILDKPSREEVEQLLRNDATRGFRVDVESDSTIRADMTRNQQNMTMFLQGTAQFAQAMGPIVLQFKEMTPAVMEVYSAFARNFKLGKQAEDALDGVADKASQLANQPQPPQQPSPEQQKAMADIQLNQQKLEFDKQSKAQELEFKQKELELKATEMNLKMQLEQAKAQHDAQMAEQESAIKQQEAENQRRLKELEMQHNAALKEQEQQQKLQLAQQQAEQDAELKRTSVIEDLKLKGQQAAQKSQQGELEFNDNRARAHQSFTADEQRKAELHAAAKKKADNEIRIQSDSADYERKTKDAEKKNPRKKTVKVIREGGKIAGAEVMEH